MLTPEQMLWYAQKSLHLDSMVHAGVLFLPVSGEDRPACVCSVCNRDQSVIESPLRYLSCCYGMICALCRSAHVSKHAMDKIVVGSGGPTDYFYPCHNSRCRNRIGAVLTAVRNTLQ